MASRQDAAALRTAHRRRNNETGHRYLSGCGSSVERAAMMRAAEEYAFRMAASPVLREATIFLIFEIPHEFTPSSGTSIHSLHFLALQGVSILLCLKPWPNFLSFLSPAILFRLYYFSPHVRPHVAINS